MFNAKPPMLPLHPSLNESLSILLRRLTFRTGIGRSTKSSKSPQYATTQFCGAAAIRGIWICYGLKLRLSSDVEAAAGAKAALPQSRASGSLAALTSVAIPPCVLHTYALQMDRVGKYIRCMTDMALSRVDMFHA